MHVHAWSPSCRGMVDFSHASSHTIRCVWVCRILMPTRSGRIGEITGHPRGGFSDSNPHAPTYTHTHTCARASASVCAHPRTRKHTHWHACRTSARAQGPILLVPAQAAMGAAEDAVLRSRGIACGDVELMVKDREGFGPPLGKIRKQKLSHGQEGMRPLFCQCRAGIWS